jgi:hypothetical protein
VVLFINSKVIKSKFKRVLQNSKEIDLNFDLKQLFHFSVPVIYKKLNQPGKPRA